MATQNLYGDPIVDAYMFPGSATFGTLAMNASNNSVGVIFQAEPWRGNIVGLGVLCTAVTSPPTYRASLQGVTSRATPDGTVKGSGGCATTFTPTANTVHALTFGSSYAASVGEILAAVVDYSSGTIGVSNTATFAYQFSTVNNVNSPYAMTQNAGTWAVGSNAPIIAPIYADGSYGRKCSVAKSITNTVPTSSSNPLWYGNSWVPAFNTVFSGCQLYVRVGTGSNFTVSLFEGSNTTAVSTTTGVAVDKVAVATNNLFPLSVPMPQYTLTAGTTYRIAVSMTTATAFTQWFMVTFDSAAAMRSLGGPMSGCTSPSSISWTDYNNGSDGYRVYPIIPQIDSITASSGGIIDTGFDGGFDG